VEGKYILPPSQERWLTAAIICSSILICGDRAGNIHVYKRYDRYVSDIKVNKTPIQTLHRIHGKIGVQSFHIFKKNLITSGRDGMLRFYEMRTNDTKPLLMLHKKKMPMDWISGILKVNIKRVDQAIEKDESLFIFGFKQV